MQSGILRTDLETSAKQTQTADAFSYKWAQRRSYEGSSRKTQLRDWLTERYGDVTAEDWLQNAPETCVLLDAGCGAGVSAQQLFGQVLSRIRYLGVDVSDAVEIAAQNFADQGIAGGFMQADITRLPLPPESVDIILAEGSLHHTDSTEGALKSLALLLKPGGRFMFYIYKKKGPIREFTDDDVRAKLQEMTPEEAWNEVMALSKLGKAIGELDVELEVPEDVALLEIPAGPINLQRFLYWHVFKCFYHPDLDLDEINHINFDWYAPRNAHRQTSDEVRAWCANAGLHVEREVVEDAGITIISRKGQ
ncbi:MAG: methyltransferase domain-containing protein [Rhodospirillales bacterium]|nr:methyltransferase domain-containing protein [Rhodospirillales bacterium]